MEQNRGLSTEGGGMKSLGLYVGILKLGKAELVRRAITGWKLTVTVHLILLVGIFVFLENFLKLR